MIIDSKKYNGACACGHEHKMTTRFCVVEAGCMKKIDQYLQEYGLNGYTVAVYDQNTYVAKGLVRPVVDQEVILPAKELHADNHGVALLDEQLPADCQCVIAIGSGTVHDIVRYCAYRRSIPFVSCPTAASVDGFCSSVAAMTWFGFKKTLIAASPQIVIADLDIITRAPMFLTRSGVGDMIGKFVALCEWKIGTLLTGEHFCQSIYDMTLEATRAVVDSAEGIRQGKQEAYEKLMYGLLLSGLAMQLLGNSRCASGAEHHISHFIEMQPQGLGAASGALHGEKVGVGTILVSREYHRLKKEADIPWRDYTAATDDYIKEMFGESLCDSIITENEKDNAVGITAAQIRTNWDAICGIIDQIPDDQTLETLYSQLGMKRTLDDIGISEDKLATILEYSPLIRNRVTLMRLRRSIL